jgi:signal transduction histidine kinase
MDSATRVFVLQNALELIEQSPPAFEWEKDDATEMAGRLLRAEELAAEPALRYLTTAAFEKWTADTLHRLDVTGDVYGLLCRGGERTFLLLRRGEDVRKDFETFAAYFPDSDVSYRVSDDRGLFVSGIAEPTEPAFLNLPVGSVLPGWQARLYFADSDIFSKAASRQVAFYIWTGALVIVLILAAGGFAAQVVSRQVRLNRLKNDFIATVSHELKTPLASMRVLVDTLLEGHYRNQQQAAEYLELVSHENERLSRLIDNFLTFSRMERNKQTFDMLRVSPVTIAQKAAEAVKTKFGQNHCNCDIKIDDDLPDILADEDAMVTALVNLLDNACKYSYDDRQIQLRVHAEDGSICFSVADNGIGMSRRAVKKVFKRFYQVDRSLSRPAGGCGLGLSIVKFVVDAHKGSISVESKPGKGSTFTIKLAALK